MIDGESDQGYQRDYHDEHCEAMAGMSDGECHCKDRDDEACNSTLAMFCFVLVGFVLLFTFGVIFIVQSVESDRRCEHICNATAHCKECGNSICKEE